MRKLLILAVLATLAMTGFEAHASGRRVRTQVSSASPGPVNRLMDLERRKNAALRQAFLGR